MAHGSGPARRIGRLVWLFGAVVVVGMWGRSYFVEDRVERTVHVPQAAGGLHTVRTSLYGAGGQIVLNAFRIEFNPGYSAWRPAPVIGPVTPWLISRCEPSKVVTYRGSFWNWLGFRDVTLIGCGRQSIFSRRQVVPYWAVLAVVAGGPVLPRGVRAGWAWLLPLVHRRRMRLAAGLCPDCGYDLRATPARCPECGVGVGRG